MLRSGKSEITKISLIVAAITSLSLLGCGGQDPSFVLEKSESIDITSKDTSKNSGDANASRSGLDVGESSASDKPSYDSGAVAGYDPDKPSTSDSSPTSNISDESDVSSEADVSTDTSGSNDGASKGDDQSDSDDSEGSPAGSDDSAEENGDTEEPSSKGKGKGKGNSKKSSDSDSDDPDNDTYPENAKGKKKGHDKASKDGDAPIYEKPSMGEIKTCAKYHKVSDDKIVGTSNNAEIEEGKFVALKVTGNKKSAEINLKGDSETTFAGVCIFATGNMARVDVNISASVGSLLYVGRGNQAETTVAVSDTGSIDTLYGDISGNQGVLSITGAGKYPCEKVRLKGNNPTFNCQENTDSAD